MNPKDALIQVIENDEKTKRFKELDAIIETHPTLYKDYENLKLLQQKMVRAKANKKTLTDEEKTYNNALDSLMNHPLMSEYLDLIESINEDIKWVTETIESSINHILGAIHDNDE